MNTDPAMSALVCGCDPAMNHISELCRADGVTGFTNSGQHYYADPRLRRREPAKQKTVEPSTWQSAAFGGETKTAWTPKDPGPTRPQLPTDAKARKEYPIYSGVLAYFPDAIAEVARVSFVGNQQHNPGEPLHWARSKSMDQEDTCVRHLMEGGTRDADGQRHSAKAAWRALAILQLEIERERETQ